MTVVLSLKVDDGVILAADGALSVEDAETNQTHYIYSGAKKLFKLHKDIPLGLLTCGIGHIGDISIDRIINELRTKFCEKGNFYINLNRFTVAEVAENTKSHIYKYYLNDPIMSANSPRLVFLLVGYAKEDITAQQYGIVIQGQANVFSLEDQCGLWISGMPEAIHRLYYGYSAKLEPLLRKETRLANIDQIMSTLQKQLLAPLISREMPIHDAANLAKFFIKTAINYTKFMPGPHKVGGRIQMAAITKHDGFKRIKL